MEATYLYFYFGDNKKMMETLKELTEEIDQRTNILFKAVLFSNDSFYLSQPATSKELELANKDMFIHKVRYSYWIISVLEMYKLYGGENDCFTIKKLLNKLLNSYTNSEWKDMLKKETIKNWVTALEDYKETINSIK